MKRPVGRPRKAQAVRRQQISVHLPQTMVSELDNRLSWSQSRSKFIESAIKEKLDGSIDWDSIHSERLCAILLNRQVISPGMFETLQKVIKAMSPIEETAKQQ